MFILNGKNKLLEYKAHMILQMRTKFKKVMKLNVK